jgi:phosphate transport system substrate-binding protein
MSQGKSKDTGALIAALLITLGLIGGGVWFFGKQISGSQLLSGAQNPSRQPENGSASPDQNPIATTAPQLDTSQPNPQVLTIDGSVSLVALLKQFQLAYAQVNPNLATTYGLPDGRPNGTNQGIQNLIEKKVAIAVSSRPLNSRERQANLQAVPIARDAIAIVVGSDNPFQGSLTLDQLKQIYQGKITNWSQVGGPNLSIKVINRAASSGTESFFRDVVLLGEAFAPDSDNFVTLPRDETTPMLQALQNNGIGYATVAQVANQKTVRLVAIADVDPTDQAAIKAGKYPLSRIVYLVMPQQTSPAVQEFVDLALSQQGQDLIQRVGFSPLK